MTPLQALEYILREVDCLDHDKCPHWVEWHNVARAAIAGEAQRGETVELGSTGTASTRAEGIAHTPHPTPHLKDRLA